MEDRLLNTPARSLGKMTIAITGANGFIGARLIEMLAAAGTPPALRTISRRRSADPRHKTVDLGQPKAVRAALESCDAVVHCAFDFLDMSANLPISSVIARECAVLGARLVHVSTAAVHEPFPDGALDETSETGSGGSAYKHAKLAIENALLGHVRDTGLDLVILRPTVVYGPFGRAWTDSPVRELLTGTVVLPDEGLCNAVYVDDVCQAIIAALTAPLPSGERILVSGPAPVAWKDFYAAYQNILGVDALRTRPANAWPAGAVEEGDGTTLDARAFPSRKRLKSLVARMLGARGGTRLNMAVSYARSLVMGRGAHVPAGAKLALFQARCDIRIDKARRLLGYEPRFDLQLGMRMTAPYVLRVYGRMAHPWGRRAGRMDVSPPSRH